FGILADDTPPVGLAAYAAAAISRGDPIKTGLQGFGYDIRTALLPFLFIFNTDLLLIDVGLAQAVMVFIVSLIAMLVFAAATQGYFIARSRIWESGLLLLVAFTLFRPGFWLDMVEAPYRQVQGTAILETIGTVPIGEQVRLQVSGPDFDTGEVGSTTIVINPSSAGDANARLSEAGLSVLPEKDVIRLDEPMAGTPFFETLANEYDFYADEPVQILSAQIESNRLPKEIFFVPALVLLGLVGLLQRGRATQPAF
ncbi:MAG: DUF3394 domain-containing protein, partial [Gammaproteobacteria bacterium]|nr:DUF3394 domain-containing protein [Gammaproteobacteria bacterium]